jgi:hypothetical protein
MESIVKLIPKKIVKQNVKLVLLVNLVNLVNHVVNPAVVAVMIRRKKLRPGIGFQM